MNRNGTQVQTTLCNAATKPATTQVCDTRSPCPCSFIAGKTLADKLCQQSVGPHSYCDPASFKCLCSAGWAGPDCNKTSLLPTPAPTPTSNTPCSAAGTQLDRRGRCCSTIDAVTGLCCAIGEQLAADGRCCASGKVDGCGICNGTGIMLDRDGVCCSSPLSSLGTCCTDPSGIDACGVCGGLNECGIVIANITVSASLNITLFTGTASVHVTGWLRKVE